MRSKENKTFVIIVSCYRLLSTTPITQEDSTDSSPAQTMIKKTKTIASRQKQEPNQLTAQHFPLIVPSPHIDSDPKSQNPKVSKNTNNACNSENNQKSIYPQFQKITVAYYLPYIVQILMRNCLAKKENYQEQGEE